MTGAIPFDGRFNPYLELEQADHPAVIPRKGRSADLNVRLHVEIRPLTHVQAAMALRTKLKAQGREWNPTHYQYLVEHYPDGIPEELLDTVMQALLLMSDNSVISLAAGR